MFSSIAHPSLIFSLNLLELGNELLLGDYAFFDQELGKGIDLN
jgi:hypothetical protein